MQICSTNTSHVNINGANVVDFPEIETSTAIARTASEIAAKFFDDNASERAPYKVRVLAYGAISTLSDGAFRLLVIRSMYADNDGTNSYPTQEVLAELMRREERTISSLDKELRNAGFMTLNRRANNRSRDLSLRSTSYNLITHTQMDRIVNEIVFDRKRTSGRKSENDRKPTSTGNHDRKQTSTGNDFDRKSVAVSTGSQLPPTLLTYPSTESKTREREEGCNLTKAATIIAATLSAALPLAAAASDIRHEQPTVETQQMDGVSVGTDGLYLRFKGRMIAVDYASIDYWAVTEMVSSERARQLVESNLRGWIVDGKIPDYPSRWLQNQLKYDKVRDQIGAEKLRNASAQSKPPERKPVRSFVDQEKDSHLAYLLRDAENSIKNRFSQ